MDYVDTIMDLAIVAVRDLLGRPVSYQPSEGDAVDLRAEFTESQQAGPDGLDTAFPALSFRTLDLAEVGIVPTAEGDAVTFSVGGISRTYRVTEVIRPDVGCVVLRLGQRS